MENLMKGEKGPVNGGDSGDEYSGEMDERPSKELFTFKLLFCPSANVPTKMSGSIVYITTAVICKCETEKV